jgi:hypothetical protein
MVERWLQWIIVGAAVAVAVFWIGATTVTLRQWKHRA